MSDTTYIDYVQPAVSAEWLNEINDHVWHDTPVQGIILHAADKIGFVQSGTGAVATNVQEKLRESVSVKDFGAVGTGADESAAANAMIAAHNYLYVPPNFTLVCKNIQLFNNTKVVCDGTLKIPSGCSDFDRLLYASNKTGIEITAREIDGNYDGQVGNIGTHLIYADQCDDISIDVKYIHDHYVASGAATPSVDGVRNMSSGCIFVYDSDRAKVNVGLLDGWGREAIYLLNCRWSDVTLGHAQGKYLTEYSGVQVSGSYNTVNRASVDFAGASAVGFDTRRGTISNIIATNTRANSGVNFGHTGYPATETVASNIIVDGAYGYGISVLSSSQDLTIDNFSVSNAGEYGISFSDGVLRGKLANGIVSNSGRGNLNASVSQVQTSNIRSSDLDAKTLTVTTTSGIFSEGETVTTATGSAVVRRRLRNLNASEQILFFASITGTFSVAQVVTGGTSGATAYITRVDTPIQRNETGGGLYVDDVRYFPGTGNQIRFPDGTAIYVYIVPCVVTTAGTVQTFTQNFFLNTVWAEAPIVTASVGSVNSTNTFAITRLSATATTSAISILLNASVNQTYGVNVIAIGRWK